MEHILETDAYHHLRPVRDSSQSGSVPHPSFSRRSSRAAVGRVALLQICSPVALRTATVTYVVRMSDRLFGSELVDYHSPAVAELEQDLEEKRRGLFSRTERRMLWGLKSYDGHQNPNASQRAKRHQIRERIVNGLTDLAIAAALLPTEDWEKVVKADSDIPIHSVGEAPADEFSELLASINGITGTLAYAADEVAKESVSMTNAIANGLGLYTRLTHGRDHARFGPYHVDIRAEIWPESRPLFPNEPVSLNQRYVQYRVGGARRRDLLRQTVAKEYRHR